MRCEAKKGRWLCAMCFAAGTALAQAPAPPAGYNYSEADVPPFTMLDPLLDARGHKVTSKAEWPARRAEIVAAFEQNVFGRVPDTAKRFQPKFRILEPDTPALDGLAIRRQVLVSLTDAKDGPAMHLLLYLPAKHAGPVPVILGLSFQGNASVSSDPGIMLTPVWQAAKVKGDPPERVTFLAEKRGAQAKEWQVEMVLRRGYGIATVYYGDIDPDFRNAESLGVRAVYRNAEGEPAWGALSAWGWGASRALDYLVTDPAIKRDEIAITGHSRLGKAADWAAAQDVRFAALLSTESGKGGQSLYRHVFGETIQHLEHSFPFWFTPGYAQWAGHDREIPVDGNELIALIAPRPLYVASAHDDLFSDPRGEFLSAADVGRVYALFGEHGLETDVMPTVDQPIMHDVAYHVRTGVHDVTAFDWEQYLKFLDLRFGSPLARVQKPGGRK